jgi:D-beta-D-heptose 7-phosphate kinase/D-beta-D-heptose 1-phosphate adenosyltransferase
MKKTICVSGGADPVHGGIIDMIKAATEYGDVIFILNSDTWLNRKKGYHLLEWEERAKILESIKYVHSVVPVDDLNGGTVEEALRRIKPNYFGLGAGHEPNTTPEKKVCEELGIECVWGLGGNKVQSSSELIERVVSGIIDKINRW